MRGVAFRLLGSAAEADDAVQEAWLRLQAADADDIRNLGGWLTTVTARIALDMLRSRRARREAPESKGSDPRAASPLPSPEDDALLAEAVGRALMVVLERLAPIERLAFVLHDLFGLSFDAIAPIIGRSPVATRQVASRARRRVQGSPPSDPEARDREREVVGAFFKASRAGDFDALLDLLDPDVRLTVDPALLPPGAPAEARGARVVAQRARVGVRPGAELMLVDGAVAIAVVEDGRLDRVLAFTLAGDRIDAIRVIADPAALAALDLAVLGGQPGPA